MRLDEPHQVSIIAKKRKLVLVQSYSTLKSEVRSDHSDVVLSSPFCRNEDAEILSGDMLYATAVSAATAVSIVWLKLSALWLLIPLAMMAIGIGLVVHNSERSDAGVLQAENISAAS